MTGRSKQRGFLLNPFRFDSGGGGVDPYWGQVVLLANLNTAIVDAKGKTLTAYGNAAISAGALALDGVGDYVSTNDGMADFRFGTGDFCVEAFVRTTNSKEQIVCDWFSSGGGAAWQLEVVSGGIYWYSTGGGSYGAPGLSIADGAWHHIAAWRTAGMIYLGMDGTLRASAANTANYNNTTITAASIGAQVYQRNASYDFDGQIRGVRVTKGSARGYGATYTVPDFPLPTS